MKKSLVELGNLVDAARNEVQRIELDVESAESGHRPINWDDVKERCSQAKRFLTKIEEMAGLPS